jgi:hypothetical protein
MLSTTGRALGEIAIAHGTDKQGTHSYTDAYEQQLGHLRQEAITLLEIGIGGYADPAVGGASLRMWKEYFPRARIIGVDIYDKSSLAEDRIEIERGDQSDPEFLSALAAKYGPFDVIVDDGSHVCEHVIASFNALFPHLKLDGIYAIEDLQTAYWEGGYGGSSVPGAPGTPMAMLRGLTDGLNYAEFDVVDYRPTYLDLNVRSVLFLHNLAFIRKGPNLEGSNFLPPHPRSERKFRVKGPSPSRPSGRTGVRATLRRVIPKPIRATVMSAYRRLRPRF